MKLSDIKSKLLELTILTLLVIGLVKIGIDIQHTKDEIEKSSLKIDLLFIQNKEQNAKNKEQDATNKEQDATNKEQDATNKEQDVTNKEQDATNKEQVNY